MKYVTLEARGPVSIVTLNRPERLNAIGLELLQDLHEALVTAQADPQTRVIVLTGAGRAFCAGDDLKEFAQQAASRAGRWPTPATASSRSPATSCSGPSW